jgi:hypothetical protein
MVNVRKEIGVDWLSITGPGSCAPDVAALLETLEPRADWTDSGPGSNYSQRLFLSCGAKLFLGRTDDSDRFLLELNGGACATLGADAVHRVGQTAMMGGRCTRLDLRCDVQGDGVTLLDDVIASVDAGHLCKVRTHSRFVQHAIRGGVTGLGQYLGSTSSTRFVRIYDKGLEQGTKPARSWIRWEAELKGDFATPAACDVFSADLDDLVATASPHMFHLADFRIGADADRNLDRLPRPQWWSDLLRDVADFDVRIDAANPSFDAWREALAHQYGRVLVAMARRAGCSVGNMAEFVLAGARPSVASERNPVVPEGVAAFKAAWLRASR